MIVIQKYFFMEFKTQLDFSKFEKILLSLSKDAEKEAEKIVIKSIENCKGNAKLKVRVDTGYLRNSIHSSIYNKNGKIEGTVTTKAEYAPYVEFGTGQTGEKTNENQEVSINYRADWKGQKAQPYLYPAFVQERDIFLKNVEDLLKKVKK